jgi:DNA-binding NarL/FixJ family response regulator
MRFSIAMRPNAALAVDSVTRIQHKIDQRKFELHAINPSRVTGLSRIVATVFAARAGYKRLSCLRTAGIDVLFSDVVMPGGIGRSLIEAQRIWPQLKVLLTSGYADERTSLHGCCRLALRQ